MCGDLFLSGWVHIHGEARLSYKVGLVGDIELSGKKGSIYVYHTGI
jgi:hypothetical protein